jgi:hypothetical protein
MQQTYRRLYLHEDVEEAVRREVRTGRLLADLAWG